MWCTPLWTFFPYMNILVWTPHLLGFLSSFFVPLLYLKFSLTNVNYIFNKYTPTKSSPYHHYRLNAKTSSPWTFIVASNSCCHSYHILLLICLHFCIIGPMLKLYHWILSTSFWYYIVDHSLPIFEFELI